MATKAPSRPRAVRSPGAVGRAIREWRTARRFSQLALGLEAEISPRHLSFIEAGRTQPSRATLLRLAEVLDVPLRDRNALVLGAGIAPGFPERPVSDRELVQMTDGRGLVIV